MPEMRASVRTWPILLFGLVSLLVLIILSALAGARMATQTYQEMETIHQSHQLFDQALNQVKSHIFLASIYLRDFLLDPSNANSDYYRHQLRESQSAAQSQLAQIRQLSGHPEGSRLAELDLQMQTYWNSLEPVFTWSADEKTRLRFAFVRRDVLPRRQNLLSMAEDIQSLYAQNYQREQNRVNSSRARFQKYYQNLVLLTLALGLIVTGVAVHRSVRLERRAAEQQVRTEQAERELRLLSQRLVKAQEEERKRLSRELHDEVGQMLTGLRLALGQLGELREGAREQFDEQLAEAKSSTEQTLRVVRRLAMGLRPSMLDDLGLGPALNWQAREVSRQTGIDVNIQITEPIDELQDEYRTCLYRVVQESLTNCVRHSKAKHVTVELAREAESQAVSLTVNDDGVGFVPSTSVGKGLGLVGMEERVRELGGSMMIQSIPGAGTTLRVRLPFPGVNDEKTESVAG
ncbi:MAG: sensor histidine kinase [Acidobacteria bacterium]|nr:MAG: sensor histidine kinase [Acidobacteriota bacterium]